MSELNILVIATGYPSKLLETIKKRGHTYTLARPGDFDLYLSDNPKGFDKVFLFGNRMVASKYDAVITRIGENRAFASAIIRQLQHNLGMFCRQIQVRTNHQREAFESTSPNLFNDGQISRHVR